MIHMDKYSEIPSCKNLTSYPTIIDIVEMIAEQEEKSVESFSPLQSTPISKMIRNGFYTVIRGEKEGTTELVPTSKSGLTTYRGQNRFNETCRPSLYRDYNEGNELYSHLQISELKVLLDSHPVIASIAGNSLYHPQIGAIHLNIHYEGLAQHYGIHTRLMDFTNDKWTAAFFATTHWVNNTYEPVYPDKDNRYGILYIADPSNPEMHAIGLQYFNRPGAQSGFALRMTPNQDLNQLPTIRKIFFRHDANASSVTYSMNQKGSRLFPEDSLIEKVDSIIKSKTFSNAAIAVCKESYYRTLPADEFKLLLDRYGISSQPEPVVSFPDEELTKEWNAWIKDGADRYLSSLHVLPLIRF